MKRCSFFIGCVIASVGLLGIFLTVNGAFNFEGNCEYLNCKVDKETDGQCYITIINSTLPECPLKNCPITYENFKCYFDVNSNCPQTGKCINTGFLVMLILGILLMVISILATIIKLLTCCCS